jgi:uncharacterized protein with FMN-binding domain
MRRIVVGFVSTVSALVLLFSYHTSLGASGSSASLAPAGADPNTPSGAAASGDSSASTEPGSTGSGSSGSSSATTYTGDAADTQWGVVQVRITVQNGKITKSEAVQYPTENPRDQEINSYAVPQLNSEVVDQQSGAIDAVSGATVTSDGYLQSLQSAIDQAGL